MADAYSSMKQKLIDNYSDTVKFRSFKSIDIYSSPYSIYYKAVVSHDDSTLLHDDGKIYAGNNVDKMAIFYGKNNFSDHDWRIKRLNKINGVTPSMQDILSYIVPSTAPAVNTTDYFQAKNKFIVLSKGSGIVKSAAAEINFNTLANTTGTFDPTFYSRYKTVQETESYYNKGYRYTFN
jgi:hypothetical protein